GVVGPAVAKRALVLDVDDERRGGGRRAAGGRLGGERRRGDDQRAQGDRTRAQSGPQRETHAHIIRHNAKIWRRALREKLKRRGSSAGARASVRRRPAPCSA